MALFFIVIVQQIWGTHAIYQMSAKKVVCQFAAEISPLGFHQLFFRRDSLSKVAFFFRPENWIIYRVTIIIIGKNCLMLQKH